MEKTVNTFQKMMLDVAPNKMEATSYYRSQLFSPVTIESNTTGALTNEKGESLAIKIPNILNVNNTFYWGYDDFNEVTNAQFIANSIGNVTYTDLTLQSEPSVLEPKIIGHSTVNEYVILFTRAGNEFFVPNNQIWLWNVLTNQITLCYHRNLGLDETTPVRRAFTRFENQNLINVYFTDGTTFFKKFNVINNINFPVINFNVVSELTYSNIDIQVTTGGTLESGIYKYGYSLVSQDGKETKISPLSHSYVISQTNFGSTGSSDKQVVVQINNIPTNFNRIKLYRFFQNNLTDDTIISLLSYSNVSQSFSYIDNNPRVQFNLSAEELLFLGTDPFTCKDFAIKDNTLFPINIKYNEFDIDDYDTRAYSFNSDRLAVVTNIINEDFQIDASTNNPNYNIVPKDFDCINPSNRIDTNVDLRLTTQIANPLYKLYRYQSDGVTMGVEGPNIKIKYVIKQMLQDTNALGTSSSQNVDLTIDSFQNPVNQKVKSLKRDEIYRFGIRFINKYGQRSFTKWITDLRIPDAIDFPITSEIDGQIYLNSLGIEVTIKSLPSIPFITGYEILRVDRTNENKTILASGFINPTMRSAFNEANTNSSLYARNMMQPLPHVLPFADTNVDVQGMQYLHNTDIIRLGASGDRFKINTRILQFYSPEFENNTQPLQASYFKINHGYRYEDGSIYAYENKDSNTAGVKINNTTNDVYSQYYNTTFSNAPGIVVTRRFTKPDYGSTDAKLNIFGNTIFTDRKTNRIQAYNNSVGIQEFRNDNLYYDADNDRTFRCHSNNALTFTIGFENDVNSLPLENFLYKDNSNFVISRATNANWNLAVLPVFDYKRFVNNQYGGDTFAAKSNNEYLVVSPYIPTTQLTTQVFEGDTFVNWWVFQKSEAYDINNLSAFKTFREIVILPIESSINLDLREDNPRTAAEINKLDRPFDNYKYDNRYSSVIKFNNGQAKPFNFTEINEFKERVLASDIKINNQNIDSWTTFRVNNYLDLNFNLGEGHAIVEYKDNLFTFQNEGVAVLQINPKVILSAQSGVEVQLGIGKLLDSYKYLSTTSGSKNQFSICKSNGGLFYYDTLQKKLMLVSDSDYSVSDMLGVSTFVRNFEINGDNPYINQGVTYGVDNYLNRVYFTFLNNNTKETLVYSTMLKSFIMFHPTNKPQYISGLNYPYTVSQDLKSVFKMYTGNYNFFNNEYYPSIVTYVLNEKPNFSKIVELLEYNSKVKLNNTDIPLETLTHIRIYNDYQDTGLVALTPQQNVKRRFREWRLIAPRENRNKIRGQHCFIELHYNNNQNKNIVLEDVITNFTPYPGSFI